MRVFLGSKLLLELMRAYLQLIWGRGNFGHVVCACVPTPPVRIWLQLLMVFVLTSVPEDF